MTRRTEPKRKLAKRNEKPSIRKRGPHKTRPSADVPSAYIAQLNLTLWHLFEDISEVLCESERNSKGLPNLQELPPFLKAQSEFDMIVEQQTPKFLQKFLKLNKPNTPDTDEAAQKVVRLCYLICRLSEMSSLETPTTAQQRRIWERTLEMAKYTSVAKQKIEELQKQDEGKRYDKWRPHFNIWKAEVQEKARQDFCLLKKKITGDS